MFAHSDLDDTLGSIRLLRIFPDLSKDGFVQCQIWHSNITAVYKCLSYVWGDDNDQQTILVNGKEFVCRSNLKCFLDVARIKHSGHHEAFWIDALCIDQQNVSERNKQVAQMGDIYAHAKCVIAWLGVDEHAARFLKFMILLSAEARSENDAKRIWWKQQSKQTRIGWKAFWLNPYWTRAWISQEIFLAKSFRILGQDTEIGRSELRNIALLFYLMNKTIASASEGEATVRMLETYAHLMAGDQGFELKKEYTPPVRRQLIHLLHHLPVRASHVPRDRFYSLRAVAEDCQSLPVNYQSSDQEVLVQLCRTMHDSLCFCSLAYAGRALDIATSSSDVPETSPLLKFSIPICQEVPHTNKMLMGTGRVYARVDGGHVICRNCIAPFEFEGDNKYLCCLRQECKSVWDMHLILPTMEGPADARSSIELICNGGDRFNVAIENFQLESERKEIVGWEYRDVSCVGFCIRLHLFIPLALRILGNKGEMCWNALEKRSKIAFL